MVLLLPFASKSGAGGGGGLSAAPLLHPPPPFVIALPPPPLSQTLSCGEVGDDAMGSVIALPRLLAAAAAIAASDDPPGGVVAVAQVGECFSGILCADEGGKPGSLGYIEAGWV